MAMTNEVTVVVGCWSGDQAMTKRLLSWIAELGRVNAPFLLICSKQCEVDTMMGLAKMAFTSAQWEEDRSPVISDWSSQEAGPKNASGPNSMWRMAAWYFHLPELKGPWMWLEPDAVPLCRDWYDVMVAEYRREFKPFYGALVHSPNSSDTHMSGVGIYDPRTPAIMTKAMIHTEPYDVAFDVADAVKVLSLAYTTTRIEDHFRAEPFRSMEDVKSRINSSAVLWHSDKTGSLLPFLRQKLGLPPKGGDAPCPIVSQTATAVRTNQPPTVPSTVGSSGAPTFNPEVAPIVDIYLKTYPRDHELASYCLMSVRRYVRGFREIIVESPKELNHSMDGMYHKLSICEEQQPGYLFQQKAKLACYKHSDAEYFLWVDSDCCFNRPVYMAEFFHNGKSKWRYTPLDLARPDQSSTWVPVMRKFLGSEPTGEYMREHPTMVPRWLLEEMEKFCLYKHGMTLGDYVMAQADPTNGLALNFSEINCAGFFAWTFHRDRFEWVPDEKSTPCLVQGFTHGGQERINQDIAKAKEILCIREPYVKGPDSIEIPESVHEWKSDKVYIAPEITTTSAIAFLVEQAQKDGFAKGRILKQLKAAGLVKGGKLPKPAPFKADVVDEYFKEVDHLTAMLAK